MSTKLIIPCTYTGCLRPLPIAYTTLFTYELIPKEIRNRLMHDVMSKVSGNTLLVDSEVIVANVRRFWDKVGDLYGKNINLVIVDDEGLLSPNTYKMLANKFKSLVIYSMSYYEMFKSDGSMLTVVNPDAGDIDDKEDRIFSLIDEVKSKLKDEESLYILSINEALVDCLKDEVDQRIIYLFNVDANSLVPAAIETISLKRPEEEGDYTTYIQDV